MPLSPSPLLFLSRNGHANRIGHAMLISTRFDFTINLRTAKALGLTISPNMLALATAVIE